MKTFSQRCDPDVAELLDVLFRRRVPRRVHLVELFLDTEIKEALCARFDLAGGLDRSDPLFETKRDAILHPFLGYDVYREHVVRAPAFPAATVAAMDTTSQRDQGRGVRDWQDEHAGPIRGWADFEAYRWPKVSDVDFSP
ncbi:MAG TPA: hypothetical protein VHE79_15475, partial [Spirochaetia bacterium]